MSFFLLFLIKHNHFILPCPIDINIVRFRSYCPAQSNTTTLSSTFTEMCMDLDRGIHFGDIFSRFQMRSRYCCIYCNIVRLFMVIRCSGLGLLCHEGFLDQSKTNVQQWFSNSSVFPLFVIRTRWHLRLLRSCFFFFFYGGKVWESRFYTILLFLFI